MANTITKGPNSLSIAVLDTDWLWSTTYPMFRSGKKIAAIAIVSGSGTDTIVIRDGAVAGPVVFSVTTAVSVTYPFGGAKVRPCLDATDLTITAGCVLGFWFAK